MISLRFTKCVSNCVVMDGAPFALRPRPVRREKTGVTALRRRDPMRTALHKLAFAAAVVGALGFGGTQAFAAPGARDAEGGACSLSSCRTYCRSVCPLCYGYCDPVDGCICEYI
jgi:hypothetical protein